MKQRDEKVFCDQCKKEIPKEDTWTGLGIHLPVDNGFGDPVGIWFGYLKDYLWFEGEDFCSLKCLIKWMQAWHNSMAEKR